MPLTKEILQSQRKIVLARLRQAISPQDEHDLKMRIDEIEEQLFELTN